MVSFPHHWEHRAQVFIRLCGRTSPRSQLAASICKGGGSPRDCFTPGVRGACGGAERILEIGRLTCVSPASAPPHGDLWVAQPRNASSSSPVKWGGRGRLTGRASLVCLGLVPRRSRGLGQGFHPHARCLLGLPDRIRRVLPNATQPSTIWLKQKACLLTQVTIVRGGV